MRCAHTDLKQVLQEKGLFSAVMRMLQNCRNNLAFQWALNL